MTAFKKPAGAFTQLPGCFLPCLSVMPLYVWLQHPIQDDQLLKHPLSGWDKVESFVSRAMRVTAEGELKGVMTRRAR